MMMHLTRILMAVLAICCFSCRNNAESRQYSFYHWKLDNNQWDSTFAQSISAYTSQSIYLHIMDISWDSLQRSAVPKAILQIDANHPLVQQDIIPVVYIESSVLQHYTVQTIQSLADRITEGLKSFQDKYKIIFTALQLDCDWYEKDQQTYFQLIKSIKLQFNTLPISATIRLYPYKYYRKMGVPPVDYGVLMCYNMGTIKDPQSKNSILDINLLNAYTKDVKYPIDIKAALPIFGWYVWFRADQYKHILYLPANSQALSTFIQPTAENWYTVIKDTTVQDKYLRQGDILRNEYPNIRDLEQSIELINQHIGKDKDIIFYHLDKNLVTQYESFLQKHLDSGQH